MTTLTPRLPKIHTHRSFDRLSIYEVVLMSTALIYLILNS